MASGTLTSAQGSAIIGTSPNDSITFTPTGTYTVEYPLGTVAISASSSAQTLSASGGQVRITCASGSVAWSVSDGNDGTPLNQSELSTVRSLVSRAGITADDTGTAWLGAPALLSFSAVLASGTSTTVLLEVRDSAGTVATAATIVADTTSQTLRQSLLMRQQSEYRFRRSSGTGSVTITV